MCTARSVRQGRGQSGNITAPPRKRPGDRRMNRLSLTQFGRIVVRVMETLPDELKGYLDNVVVDVEEEPDEETLRGLDFTDEEIADGESLYGLFVPFALPSGDAGG